MSSAYLLERCEHIVNISAWMLAAARDGNWQEVERLRARAELAIGEVRMLSATISLSTEERRIKLTSMQRILANDGRIRALSEPWLQRMAHWLPESLHATSRVGQIL